MAAFIAADVNYEAPDVNGRLVLRWHSASLPVLSLFFSRSSLFLRVPRKCRVSACILFKLAPYRLIRILSA